MRIFTAIPLPRQTKDSISEMLRGRLPIPYINTTDLHITLNFFGELSDAQVEKVKNDFSRFTSDQNGFQIEFDSIKKINHQLHLAVKPSKELMELQTKMEKEYVSVGFTFQDRAFYPHVKLGNLHMDNVMNRQRKMENFPNQELSKVNFRAVEIALYESKLLLHHPKHILLLESHLA
ncbi:MAG: RNA 2',3'-cyclic phosphodiesterase [Candidatus Doudnabacteria bacterium]